MLAVNLAQAETTIKTVKAGLTSSPEMSSDLRSGIESLIERASELLGWAQLNSQNSSQPPSSDPNRDKKRRSPFGRKPGGQPGRTGTTLKPTPDPDKIVTLKVSAKDRPQPRSGYREVEPVTRQVIDIIIKPEITEYRAQVLEDAQGRRFTASFPAGITQAIQSCGLSEPLSIAAVSAVERVFCRPAESADQFGHFTSTQPGSP